jgi:tRNA threonylcarbamoyladenosine biosynthesis protein TsaB
MLILTIRTDKPEAEIGLYTGSNQLAYETWEAHRKLAETLHAEIRNLLAGQNKQLNDLKGIACYSGPGSFTGLRIGITTGNALAYALEVPIAATTGSDWQDDAIGLLENGEGDTAALPEYGAPVHITPPKS